jgi:hypothetical protein
VLIKVFLKQDPKHCGHPKMWQFLNLHLFTGASVYFGWISCEHSQFVIVSSWKWPHNLHLSPIIVKAISLRRLRWPGAACGPGADRPVGGFNIVWNPSTFWPFLFCSLFLSFLGVACFVMSVRGTLRCCLGTALLGQVGRIRDEKCVQNFSRRTWREDTTWEN